MRISLALLIAMFAIGIPMFGQASDTPYQIGYAAHLDIGDSAINLSNSGAVNGFDPAGRICVNVYTFDPAEELISCCTCPVTPNGLRSLSARQDLISNTLTPGVPTSIVIKLLASTGVAGVCNASTVGTGANVLATSMLAWGTTLAAQPTSPATYTSVMSHFIPSTLSASELSKLTSFCGFIQANGSGFGVCRSCRVGALGAVEQ